MNDNSAALLIDLTRCIGCRSCVVACQENHGFPVGGSETGLSATVYTTVAVKGDLFVRQLCLHCVDPACVSVCPVEALKRNPSGSVVYDHDRCIGCRYCLLACPFNVPCYEWDQAVPYVRKCDLCYERLVLERLPACVEACPVQATVFGSREELIAEAHRRIGEAPGSYFPRVYGESEVGGTSVLFLSPVSFASLGFPQGLGEEPLRLLTSNAMNRLPGVVVVGGAVLLALWWITNRRYQVAEVEAEGAEKRKRGQEQEDQEEGDR